MIVITITSVAIVGLIIIHCHGLHNVIKQSAVSRVSIENHTAIMYFKITITVTKQNAYILLTKT